MLVKVFGAFQSDIKYEPNYNVAPTQRVLVITNEGSKQLLTCIWGFIPEWAKDPSIGNTMINARAETLPSKPAFRSAFLKHRCLIIADGFYEWRKTGKKVPVYIRFKSGRPFGIAGLYNRWLSNKGETICTCTIITTDANDLLSEIHDRMPAIIPPGREDFWLDPANRAWAELQLLLKPYPSEEMDCFEVSSNVNVPGYNSPENIIPV